MLVTPYFHPTTVVFADDNDSFLRSLELSLPSTLTYRAFSRGLPAEAYLRSLTDVPDLPSRCIQATVNAANQPVLTFDLSEVEREIADPQRFSRVSVAVIDYAMPDIDGIELCRRIKDVPVKKLLLTGVADEKIAVAAFNEGLIDRFVLKTQSGSVSNSIPHIDELTRAYFEQYVDRLVAGVAAASPGFLADPVIADRVNAALRQHRAVEWYLVSSPAGLLMLDADGRQGRIAVANRADRAAQLAYAERHNAPEPLREQLAAGHAIGVYSEAVEDYYGEAYPWADNIVSAEALAGGEWSLAVLQDTPVDVDFDANRCSYRTHLETHRPTPAAQPDDHPNEEDETPRPGGGR